VNTGGTYGDEEGQSDSQGEPDLSDTEADIHQEGKALTDESRDLGEKLDDLLTGRKRDD
jgi:hypothetical protein